METTTLDFISALSKIAVYDFILVFLYVFVFQGLRFWKMERDEDGNLIKLSPSKQKENDDIKEALYFIVLHASILGTVLTLSQNWGIPWWDNFFYGRMADAGGNTTWFTNLLLILGGGASAGFWITNLLLIIAAIIAKELGKMANNFKLIFKIFICILVIIIVISNLVSAFIPIEANHKTEIVVVKDNYNNLPQHSIHIEPNQTDSVKLENCFHWKVWLIKGNVIENHENDPYWVFTAGSEGADVNVVATYNRMQQYAQN